jgi:hypothetical protein
MSTKRHPAVRELVPAAILLLATLGFFWRILFTGDAWKPAGGGDLVSFLFPTYRFAAASFGGGILPLWNPHLYSGAPFLADMQTGLFYLPNLILFLIAPEFDYEALQWMVVLHVFLAGLLMYLCLRYLEPGRPVRIPAAMAGAIAFMFSDLYIVHFGNLNLVAVAAWLPLIFLLFWRALRARSLGLAAGAGAVFGLSTLEGHLQITLYTGLALAVATAVEAVIARRSGRGWAWSILALIITAAVAIGLSALVLLPTFEYARLSPRAELPYREAARYSLEPGLLGEMLVPALFGSREPSLYWGVWDRVAVGYLGIFPLILAGLAVLMRRGRRVALFASLAVVAFLLALGGASIVHGWAYRLLPGFDQIRAPARAIVLVDFALAALAALALDLFLGPLDLKARGVLRGAWRGLVWFGAAAILIGAAWAYLVIYQAQGGDTVLFWRVSAAGSGVIFALLMLAASLAWLGARRSGRLRLRTLAWLAVGLIFLDLASVGAYSDLGTKPPTEGFDHPEIIEFLEGDPEFFRIDSRTDVWGVWQPSLALLAGLYDVGGVDNPLVIADVARFWEGTGGRSTRLYDLLGVRYVLGSKEVTLDWDKFSLAFDGDPDVDVYHNEMALPRALVVHQATVAADHEDAWTQIQEPGFDPATTVVLEGGNAVDLQQAVQASVEVVRYEPNVVEIEVDSEAEGYLFLSDPYYPGWRAEVDGEPATILRANYAFRAVAVPAGSHRVTMAFRPGTWYAGLGISVFTAAVLLILGVWVVLRRGRRET